MPDKITDFAIIDAQCDGYHVARIVDEHLWLCHDRTQIYSLWQAERLVGLMQERQDGAGTLKRYSTVPDGVRML